MARQVLDHGVIIPAEYSDDWFEDMSTNLNKLDEVIGSDAGKLSEADVSNVALSGDYDDLTNKPYLKPVATSGDYDDLTNKPSYGILRMTSETLSDSGSGAISNLNSDSKLAAGDYVLDAALKVFLITAVSALNYTVGTALFQVTDASSLAAVATSGSYDDLNNLPAYGITRFVNAAITDNSNVAFASISSVDKIKAGDLLLDVNGKLFAITAVDTANETVSVTTPITVLLNANADQNILARKIFYVTPFIYNPAPAANTPNLFLKSAKAVKGDTSGSNSDGTRIAYTDKNDKLVNYIQFRKTSNGSSDITLYCATLDNNNQDISSALTFFKDVDGNAILRANADNDISLGHNSYKFKDVRSYQLNGLEPSSLSLPNLSSSGLDISGSLQYLNGTTNYYTPPANGWIIIDVDNGSNSNYIRCVSNNYVIAKVHGNGQGSGLAVMFPVISNLQVSIKIVASTLNNAYFIPCLGNV